MQELAKLKNFNNTLLIKAALKLYDFTFKRVFIYDLYKGVHHDESIYTFIGFRILLSIPF